LARPSRTDIPWDAGWLALQAFLVILVFFVGPMVYRNRGKIAKKIRQTLRAVRRSLRTKRLLRLLRKRSRSELLEIAFCLIAWQEEGFTDADLIFPKPPHYPAESGAESNGQQRSEDDFGKSLLLALTRMPREEIIRFIDKSLGNRSLETLHWLCRCLEDPTRTRKKAPDRDDGTEQTEEVTGDTSVLERPLETLNAAGTIEEMKTIRDKARTMEAWCRLAGLSLAIQNEYTEVGVRAEREMGRRIQVRIRAGQTQPEGSAPLPSRQNDRMSALLGFRISRREAAVWHRLAEIPEQMFEGYIRKVRDAGTELTRDGLLGFALDNKREHTARSTGSSPALSTAKPVEFASPSVSVAPPRSKTQANDAMVLKVGDFRDVLRDIPDNSLDAIVTQPPPGLNSFPLWFDLGSFARRTLRQGRLLVAGVSPSDLPHVLQALGASLTYVWLGTAVFRTQSETVTSYRIRSFHTPVLFFSNGAFEARSWISDAIQPDTEQPPDLLGLGAFIEVATLPGELVCDPFVGQGLVPMAARYLGRQFIGCDVHQAALDETRRRMADRLNPAGEA
jgi:hypothetical protein